MAPNAVSGRPSELKGTVLSGLATVALLSSFLKSAADSMLPFWKYHSTLVSRFLDCCGSRAGLPTVAVLSNGFGMTVCAAMMDSDARLSVLPQEARQVRLSVRSSAALAAGSTLV